MRIYELVFFIPGIIFLIGSISMLFTKQATPPSKLMRYLSMGWLFGFISQNIWPANKGLLTGWAKNVYAGLLFVISIIFFWLASLYR